MSISSPVEGRGVVRPDRDHNVARDMPRRLSTETKASYKTTEFIAYVALMVAILIAGALTSGGVDRAGVHHADVFPAHEVWLYATILTIGYMVSRGLAKTGSRQPYDENDSYPG